MSWLVYARNISNTVDVIFAKPDVKTMWQKIQKLHLFFSNLFLSVVTYVFIYTYTYIYIYVINDDIVKFKRDQEV